MNTILVAARVTLITLVLTGVVYPIVSTGIAIAIFPDRANGSLVHDETGRVVGSEWIGQGFAAPGYFQGRISAAGERGFDATASGGSNLGPTSKKLHDRVAADAARLMKDNPESTRPVPSDLLTASGSGLDPHISPQAASWQIPRVARARGLAPERIRQVVQQHEEGRDLGFLGEARVNLLLLNLALDRQFGPPPR